MDLEYKMSEVWIWTVKDERNGSGFEVWIWIVKALVRDWKAVLLSDPVLESVPVSEVTESLPDPVLEVVESVAVPVSEVTESVSDPVLEVLEPELPEVSHIAI